MRVVLYDDTCRQEFSLGPLRLGLTHSWIWGASLFKSLGRVDRYAGVKTWAEAFDFLKECGQNSTISSLEYWGHGKWGEVRVGCERLRISSFEESHPHYNGLLALQRCLSAESTLWFRTCETFGGDLGHAFAQRAADFFNCRVAGHTHIIGPVQSGFCMLEPGQEPYWHREQGICEGTAKSPQKALWSTFREPMTLTCLGKLPQDKWERERSKQSVA